MKTQENLGLLIYAIIWLCAIAREVYYRRWFNVFLFSQPVIAYQLATKIGIGWTALLYACLSLIV